VSSGSFFTSEGKEEGGGRRWKRKRRRKKERGGTDKRFIYPVWKALGGGEKEKETRSAFLAEKKRKEGGAFFQHGLAGRGKKGKIESRQK